MSVAPDGHSASRMVGEPTLMLLLETNVTLM